MEEFNNFIELCEESPKEAMSKIKNGSIELDHSQYDRAIEEALENLDEDVKDSYGLLNALVKMKGMKTKLLSLSPREDKMEFNVYDSRSPFDKIFDFYLEDTDDRRLRSLIKLISANQRYAYKISLDNSILDYSQLEKLVLDKIEDQ